MRYLGEIANTREAIRKLVKKLGKAHGTLQFCYEAGPCGYGIHHHRVIPSRENLDKRT